MAKIKNGKNYSKQLLQQLQQQQQQAQQQTIQKNIKKIKYHTSEEKIIEGKHSPYLFLERRTKREEQKYNLKKKIRSPYNEGYYPQVPNLQFPDQLVDCLIKVICSFGNNAKHNQIIKNLSLYYTDEVQEEVVNFTLAESEETGTIYELDGKFKVTDTLIQKAQLENNDQIGQQLKHEDIEENDNDQFPSLSNNPIQQDQDMEENLNQFRKHN
ncbi:unnamed protein product [Paramecium primaurelia]|uniref:Uncharacterized protein n=1 Tax=Paramecium primaurelia TaxID=5886 RepID=A0A8S1M7X8_PARPR|nr:unnamed protein product [Paramecium primaurelia]